MSFLDTLDNDAVNTFIVEFAEPIIYTQFDGNITLNIMAIINRDPAAAIPGIGAGYYKHEIMICNDATAGVTNVNKGKDTVQFANVVGGAVETFIVSNILQSDQGIFHLAVG